MGIANVGRMAAVALLLIAGASCHRSPQSKELAALDSAYQSGVLTKAEYQAKRAALETQSTALAALDKALEAGVLSKDEYQARRAQVMAKTAALAALERAHNAGVLTKDEYLAKRSALLAPDAAVPTPPQAQDVASAAAPAATTAAASAPPPSMPQPPMGPGASQAAPPSQGVSSPAPGPSAQGSNAQGHVLRVKVVKAVDQYGFDHPMASASMLVPTDWQSQGGTTWVMKDKCNGIQTSLRTSGPDGRGVEIFPTFNWVWADDPTSLKATAAQTARLGSHPCDVMPPMNASDFLRRNLSRYRPNAQLVKLELAPKLMDLLQQQARQNEQAGGRYNLKQRIQPDVIKGRVRYSLNGQAIEEWIVAATIVTGTLGQSYNARSMQTGQAYSYKCAAYVTGEWAPEGQLDSSEKFFELVAGTYRPDPAWQAKVSGHLLAMQQIQLKGVHDRAAIVSKNADDIRYIQRQSYENTQRAEDHRSEQWAQTMRGVETYRNPSTGETVELSNLYGHAWVNNRGEYLLSDQASFDPSVTFKEDWKPLEHVVK
jgi:hypothetical protein